MSGGPAVGGQPPRTPWLPPQVWLLGWISLATDTASEAIYPLLPLFLTVTLGAGPLTIGVIEGAAEATSAILKLFAGRWSDALGRRPFVVGGYGVSSIVRPLIAFAASWWHVFGLRFVDRVGKGVRGAPRDAMLADLAPGDLRGRVFGVHRAMDHAGAVVGPVLASAYLWFAPGDYRTLFLLTVVPGLVVLALVTRVPRDVRRARVTPARGEVQPSSGLPRSLWALFGVIGVFSLANSTDAYLLLRLSALGVPAAAIPLSWAALHVVKSGASVGGGLVADRLGKRSVIAAGWLVYAAVYAGFAVATSMPAIVSLFLVYGLYFGLTEGVEKALVADLAPAARRGFAFGVYNALVGVGALAASVVFGLMWERVSPAAAFWLGATLALTAALLLGLVVRPRADAPGVAAQSAVVG